MTNMQRAITLARLTLAGIVMVPGVAFAMTGWTIGQISICVSAGWAPFLRLGKWIAGDAK